MLDHSATFGSGPVGSTRQNPNPKALLWSVLAWMKLASDTLAGTPNRVEHTAAEGRRPSAHLG